MLGCCCRSAEWSAELAAHASPHWQPPPARYGKACPRSAEELVVRRPLLLRPRELNRLRPCGAHKHPVRRGCSPTPALRVAAWQCCDAPPRGCGEQGERK